MKKTLFVLCLNLLLFSCKNFDSVDNSDCVNDFKTLSAQFAEPSQDYGTAPLYVWNTNITREKIDRSMKEMKNKNFGGVFIHPRPGLVTPYFSDEWFDLYRYAIDKGKELGLNVWIYDENSYPSGFAGGLVPEAMPESYNQGSGLKLTKSEQYLSDADKYYLCLKEDNGKYIDVTGTAKVGDKGDFYLFEKTYYPKGPWYGGYSYVDLLKPGVTQKFIEITMTNGYEKHFADEFGTGLKGWFTDEPNTNPMGSGIRWTPDLFEAFQQRWGYDLKSNLPSLYEEVGNWKRVRHDYWELILELFIDRWAKPCYEYCEAHNLLFTGHYWEHGWPALADGPDNMAMYAWHQQPSIDMLFNQFNENSPQAQFGNIRSVKELRSVANQKGRTRTLSETYGGGGWDETFKDFKRLGDWEYVLGVNLMNQHVADISIAGARKYDYPPIFSAVSPWWEYYGIPNKYFARLSLALSAGKQINDILVIEPTSSVWLYYAFGNSNPQYMEIGKAFQTFVTNLEKHQTEYDLGSENIIKDCGSVSESDFVVGECKYKTVVIPPMTENIESPTFALLKDFAANGGNIVAYSNPEYLDGVENEELTAFFKSENIIHSSSNLLPDEVVQLSPKFNFAGGNLYHQRRIMRDGQLLFLVNSSMNEECTGTVSLCGKYALELCAVSGKIFDYPERNDGKNVTLAYRLPPAGSLLLYVSDKKLGNFEKSIRRNMNESLDMKSSRMTVKPASENILTIDFCDINVGGKSHKDMHIYYAADLAYKLNGFEDGNPWNTSVQFKDRTISKDTMKTGGFEATYHFTVEDEFDYSSMKAIVERAELYKIFINGNEVKPERDKVWIDPEMNILNIGAYVRKGENNVKLLLSPMRIMAEIEQVIIMGDFTVVPAEKGWKIKSPRTEFTNDSWKEQGWPFYAGKFVYSKNFEIERTDNLFYVTLGRWDGTLCEVIVNGESAGIIGFGNEDLNVTDFVKLGSNKIDVIVVGSNRNLFGPFHNKSAVGIMSPWHFRNVESYPSGEKYLQMDYGLVDFSLREYSKINIKQ